MGQSQFTYDTALELEDGGALIASTEVNSGGILDLGAGEWQGVLVCDVTAIEIATNDESYIWELQGSNDAAFASGIEILATREVGALEIIGASTDVDVDSTTGRYITPCRNEINGTVYRYVRLKCVVAGTIATGIQYRAYLSQIK